MIAYVKGYPQRCKNLVAVIAIIITAQVLYCGLFHEKLNSVGGQIANYDTADYTTIYVLNYGEYLDNECIYPDTDIQLFLDSDRNTRLTVSSVMKEEGVNYSLHYLSPVSTLQDNEICISKNVAEQYGINHGDEIYAEYSYSPVLVPLKVSCITNAEYDYLNPNTDSGIGIVYLGYDEKYQKNVISKYMLFSGESKAQELSVYPQIINSVINKSELRSDLIEQVIPSFMFLLLFTASAILLSHYMFFRKSRKYLFRCYLKGMQRYLMIIIPLMEKIAFCLIPWIVVQHFMALSLESGVIQKAYCFLPTCIIMGYCMASFMDDACHFRKKGV